MQYIQIVVALAAVVGTTVSSPLDRRSTRLVISDCNGTPYIHWGDANLGSCSDSAIPMNADYCTASGVIPTPSGDGVWNSAGAGCQANATNEIVGYITAPSNDYYTCFSDGVETFSEDCSGTERSCTVKLDCFGS